MVRGDWELSSSISTAGSIIGKVTPKESYPVVTVCNEKDMADTLPNKDGYFKLMGLKLALILFW